MLLDANLVFDPAATAVTASADSTNIIDLGIARDLGIGGDPEPKILVLSAGTFASTDGTATLTIQLEGAPDNAGSPGSFTVYDQSPALTITRLNYAAGTVVWNVDLAGRAAIGFEGNGTAIPRFLKLHYVVGTENFSAGTLQSYIVIGKDQPTFYPSGFTVNN